MTLPLESLLPTPAQAGDLPLSPGGPDGPDGSRGSRGPVRTAALARADVVSVAAGGATFAGTADGPLVVRVAAVADGVIRVSLGRDGTERPRSEAALALVREPGGYAGCCQATGPGVRVTAGDLTAVVGPDPWSLRFQDASGRALLVQQGDDTGVNGARVSLPFGRTALPDGRTVYHVSFEARPDEQFYGLGERFTAVGKRGTRTVAWIEDALGVSGPKVYKAVPYYWSTRGYALLVNGGAPAEIDLCSASHSTVSVLTPDDTLEFYVIRADGPEDALPRLRALTGTVPLPPRWAFGTWLSAGFQPDTQESVLERARQVRRDGFPADVLHIDPYWQRPGCWSDLAWDTGAFPAPRAMTAELRDLGFRLCLWINPYISTRSPRFAEAERAGYFLRRADGTTWTGAAWGESENLPPMAIVDFTSPAATSWWQGLLRGLLADGVAVFKTDFGEAVPAGTVASNGLSGLDLHNVYTLLYNDAAANVTEAVHGYRLVWGRSSFTGGQRHAAQWGGDPVASDAGMGSTLRGGLSYAFSGATFWSHDVGGFYGPGAPDLYLRWAWFGALSPLIRFHGVAGPLPWDQDPATCAATRDIVAARYRLLPYLYSSAIEAVAEGRTLLRPMIAAAPGDRGTRDADGQYLLGRDLLVAPVTAADGRQEVYLPHGPRQDWRWIDYGTRAVHEGGGWRRVTRAPGQVPAFVRHGTLLPVDPGQPQSAAAGPDTLTLEAWGGIAAGTTVRDERGATEVRMTLADGAAQVTARGPWRLGRLEWPLIDGEPRPDRVTVDGEPWLLDRPDPGRLVARPPR